MPPALARLPRNAAPLLICLFVTSVALARIARNTIDPIAVLTDDGRHVILTGPVECTTGERLHTRLTLSQRSTGAVAEGRTFDTCTGAPQQWEVDASVQGKARFEAGAAVAVAVGRTVHRGRVTDAHQWLVDVTLVEE
jgi:hypothetical protein